MLWFHYLLTSVGLFYKWTNQVGLSTAILWYGSSFSIMQWDDIWNLNPAITFYSPLLYVAFPLVSFPYLPWIDKSCQKENKNGCTALLTETNFSIKLYIFSSCILISAFFPRVIIGGLPSHMHSCWASFNVELDTDRSPTVQHVISRGTTTLSRFL